MDELRKKSFWGWGWEDRFPDAETRKRLARQAKGIVGFAPERFDEPPRLESIEIVTSRIEAPQALAGVVTSDPETRVRHTYGRSYRDILRGFRGDFSSAPDLVATPRSEAEIAAVLDWAGDARVAVVPYGGGTSVVSGVEADAGDRYRGVVSLDLGHLDRVLEVEPTSLSARVQAGALGPSLETQLGEHGLTLRHFPQSFEFSTLGGWIATRAGGHFATIYTHIDDLVQSIRAITPSGVWESRRLPASGAGPSPDRLMLGSEGALGVITEAWVRVRKRPTFRGTATIHFEDFDRGVDAVRALSQSGLFPSNCRLLDKREAMLNAVTTDGSHVLIVAFESADHSVRPWLERALELTADHGGACPGGAVYEEDGQRSGATGGAASWRQAFLDAPYMLNTMASMGVILDTFETACTWDRFEALHAGVIREVSDALNRVCGGGFLTCRFTHVYPDGPAPYFTFLAPGRYGVEAEQWMAIKQVASEAVIAYGGTITHHHAVGRIHRPWYGEQRPPLFEGAWKAAKGALDPQGILNPGVLFDS